jgi:hypothetical protein
MTTQRLLLVLLAAVACGLPAARAADDQDTPKFIERGGVRFFIKEKRMEIDGKITITEGPIELLACSRGGKEHESIVSAPAKPSTVKFFATLMGLKEGTPDGTEKQRGSPVEITVRWKAGGKTVTRRADELIWNVIDKRPMKQTVWVFVGGRIARNPGATKKVFLPDMEGSIVTTWSDLNAVFKLPSKLAENDEAFVARKENLPPQETPCTMIISRATWPEPARNALGGRVIDLNVSAGGRLLFDNMPLGPNPAAEIKAHGAKKENSRDTYVLIYDHGAPAEAGIVALNAVAEAGIRLSSIRTTRMRDKIRVAALLQVKGDEVQFGDGLSAEKARAAISAAAADGPVGVTVRIEKGASYTAIARALEPMKGIGNAVIRLIWEEPTG